MTTATATPEVQISLPTDKVDRILAYANLCTPAKKTRVTDALRQCADESDLDSLLSRIGFDAAATVTVADDQLDTVMRMLYSQILAQHWKSVKPSGRNDATLLDSHLATTDYLAGIENEMLQAFRRFVRCLQIALSNRDTISTAEGQMFVNVAVIKAFGTAAGISAGKASKSVVECFARDNRRITA